MFFDDKGRRGVILFCVDQFEMIFVFKITTPLTFTSKSKLYLNRLHGMFYKVFTNITQLKFDSNCWEGFRLNNILQSKDMI